MKVWFTRPPKKKLKLLLVPIIVGIIAGVVTYLFQLITETIIDKNKNPDFIISVQSFDDIKEIDSLDIERLYYADGRQTDDAKRTKIDSFIKAGRFLKYTYNKDKQSIDPVFGYIDNAEQGYPIHPYESIVPKNISECCFFYTPFPVIDIKVVNNTNSAIFIHKVIFEILNSKTNPQAIPVVNFFPNDNESFTIINEGWGAARNVRLRFNISLDGEYSFKDNYMFNRHIDTINDSYSVDLIEELKYLDVNIDSLNSFATKKIFTEYFVCTLDNKPSDFTEMKLKFDSINKAYCPRFKKLFEHEFNVVVYGELTFETSTLKEKNKTIKYHFYTNVPLISSLIHGAVIPPRYPYSIMLDLDKKNYIIEKEISQAINPLDFDRFQFKIGALKSSEHRFKIKFIYNNDQIYETDLQTLNILTTKSFINNYVKEF